jgi:hypothetical protein
MQMLNGDDPRGLLFILIYLPLILMSLVLAWDVWRHAARIRRFRCRTAGRDVEVTFVDNEIRSCSAFDPPGAIACGRTCRDSAFRRHWESALPVFTRRRSEA